MHFSLSRENGPSPTLKKNGRCGVFLLGSALYGERFIHVSFCLDIAKTTSGVKAKKASMAIKMYKVFDANLTGPAFLCSRLFG